MDELGEFLRARLDEDEAAANPGGCGCLDANHVPSCTPTPWRDRPLREVKAKRALLALADDAYYAADHYAHDGIRAAIAAVYSGHPDFKPGWASTLASASTTQPGTCAP